MFLSFLLCLHSIWIIHPLIFIDQFSLKNSWSNSFISDYTSIYTSSEFQWTQAFHFHRCFLTCKTVIYSIPDSFSIYSSFSLYLFLFEYINYTWRTRICIMTKRMIMIPIVRNTGQQLMRCSLRYHRCERF